MSDDGRATRAREDIVATARRLAAEGLTHGTSGNISSRVEDGLLITPSGVAYGALAASDVVRIDWHGTPIETATGRRPSSEWRLHAAVLQARADIDAIVHAHSPWATALSCLRRDIPPFHYMVAIAGGPTIRCAAYATYGTPELAEAAVSALDGRSACLLANHGLVACGATVQGALELAIEIEALAGQYGRALAAGEPILLDEDEMRRVLERFSAYRAG